jgi:uncharacterized protein (TIGR03083 family)
METDPHRWIAVLRHSQDRLASLVGPLTPEQLRGPSYHSWTIAQVLGHLGSQAELFTGWLTAALEGTDPPGRDIMQPIWDAWNAREPEAQAVDAVAYGERLMARFESLTDDQLAQMHLNLFGMELDAVGLARIRLSELAIHTWDIAVALDSTARVEAGAVGLLIDTLGFIANRTGKPRGKTFRLHVMPNNPQRHFSLAVGESVQLTEWTDAKADGELRIPGEAFLRLIYGRLDPQHNPEIEVTGPVGLRDLRQIFPGV